MASSPDPITKLNAALEGRYAIEREIGEGGMATVYLAHDERHNRNVALKVLKPELAAVVGAERFLAEIETTAQLTHPHILPLHDSGEADGFLFFVTPFIEGDTLRNKIDREKQLSVEEAIRITSDIAEALDHAHRHGVVHRDIKPANILLTDGRPVIADFGIALAVGAAGGGRLTETGLSLGTPHYMSPEQATGDLNLGPQTDTYALGCVLYEMLVGEPPYTGPNAQAVLGQIISGDAVSATGKRASVPPNVDAAIRKALEKLPADRFGSAEDFATALGDPGFRHGRDLLVGATTRGGPWKTLSLVLGASTVALALGFGALLLRPEPRGSVERFRLTTGVGSDIQNDGVDLTLSPDGTQIVFSGVSGGTLQLFHRALNQLESTSIPGTSGASNPRFSPDGESVAFIGAGGLSVVSLSGGPPLVVVSDSVSPQAGFTWGPDSRLYFAKRGLGIWRVPVIGGPEEEVTTLSEGESVHRWPEVLPDARGILFTRSGVEGPATENRVTLLSLETGATRELLQGAMARYADSGHIVYASNDGTLLASPFDLDRLEITGPSRTLLEGVQTGGVGTASDFAFSQMGDLVYIPQSALVGTGGGVPVWIARDGSQELLDEALTGLFEAPAFSPDGRRVALQRQMGSEPEDIWIYDLGQRTVTRLTFGGSRNLQPFWSPDGREVGFSSNRDGPLFALYSRPADLSGDARLLVSDPNDGLYEGRWSPNGGALVYRWGSVTTTGNQDLRYSEPGSDVSFEALPDAPASENSPSLSPDGRWLAYASNESGEVEVYVRPFPGPGGQSLVSVGGGRNPKWAPSGREIFYMGPDSGTIHVATVRTDPDFLVESRAHIEAPDLYIQTIIRHWDLEPNGERLLAIRAVGLDLELILVQNFFEELRQVVPE